MAWVKIPKENHPIFRAAVPKGATTKTMFGGVAGLVNGNMFGGLFARSICVKLGASDQKAALALDGAEPFDPMGNGRIMRDTVLLPEFVMDDETELKSWLARAFDYVQTLPKKQQKQPKAKRSSKVTKTASAKKPAAKQPKAKKSPKVTKTASAKKPKKTAKRAR